MRISGKSVKKIIVIPFLLLLASVAAYAAATYLRTFDFNNDRALDKWGNMILNGKVDYNLMKQGSNGYIEALSDKACSALYYRVGYNLKKYPFLSWKWRVLKFPDKASAKTDLDRDDYAARVYVIFPFLSFSSSKFIEYVWSDDLPEGTMTTSPRGNNIKLIVARSGPAKDGEWLAESRNVYEDYIKAFGKKPGMGVGAVAIMCDADNTGTSAESLFDDIQIENKTGLMRRVN